MSQVRPVGTVTRGSGFDFVREELQLGAVLALPHRQRRDVVGNGMVVDPAKRRHRGLNDPQNRYATTDTARLGIAQLCHCESVRLRPLREQTPETANLNT